MESILTLGIIAGLALYLAKLGSFYLLLMKWPKGRHWVHNTPIAMFFLDLLGGYIAGHFFIGSNIGMIAMITFGTISMSVIFLSIAVKKYNPFEFLTSSNTKKVHEW